MQNKNKQLLKQLGLFSAVMFFFYSFGYAYELFSFSFFILLIFFVPFYLIYLIKRQNKNVKFVHNVFKIIAWILSPLFIIFFLMSFWEAFHVPLTDLGISFFENILIDASVYFNPIYLMDFGNEYGIKSDLIGYLYAGGYLVAVAVFYWAIKINKKIIVKLS